MLFIRENDHPFFEKKKHITISLLALSFSPTPTQKSFPSAVLPVKPTAVTRRLSEISRPRLAAKFWLSRGVSEFKIWFKNGLKTWRDLFNQRRSSGPMVFCLIYKLIVQVVITLGQLGNKLRREGRRTVEEAVEDFRASLERRDEKGLEINYSVYTWV